jgi:murein DD-endopeptidase MepM/ murein hydrolase activator NlpD
MKNGGLVNLVLGVVVSVTVVSSGIIYARKLDARPESLVECLDDSKMSSSLPDSLQVYGEHQKTLGTTFFDFYRYVFSDKDDEAGPGPFPIGKKTADELQRGLLLKDSLDSQYQQLFSLSNLPVSNDWASLVAGSYTIPKGTFNKEHHRALDVFTKEGTLVKAPFNGVVVASGDEWEGSFSKGVIKTWNERGLSPRAGNAVVLYNPADSGYLFLSHFQQGLLVQAGDMVQKGDSLGFVGHSGSASIKGHGNHVHASYKLPVDSGYFYGVDFRKMFVR